MTTSYSFPSRVRKIEKRRHVGRILRDPKNKDAVLEEDVTENWVMMLEQGISIVFEEGEEPPEFEQGDKVKITISKVL